MPSIMMATVIPTVIMIIMTNAYAASVANRADLPIPTSPKIFTEAYASVP